MRESMEKMPLRCSCLYMTTMPSDGMFTCRKKTHREGRSREPQDLISVPFTGYQISKPGAPLITSPPRWGIYNDIVMYVHHVPVANSLSRCTLLHGPSGVTCMHNKLMYRTKSCKLRLRTTMMRFDIKPQSLTQTA